MPGVGIDWSLASPQPNALAQAMQGFQQGRQMAQQDRLQAAYRSYDPANPSAAVNALFKAGAPNEANALLQASLTQQKQQQLSSLDGYKPAAYVDPFARAGGSPSPAPGMTNGSGAGGVQPNALVAPASLQATPNPAAGSNPSSWGLNPPPAIAAAPAQSPPTSQDVTVTGKPPSGYDFRNTLNPQDASDPVLAQKLALMQAHGYLTKDQVDAYHQAYSAMPPGVRQAQQTYTSEAARLATQAADITGDDAQDTGDGKTPGSGNVNPDSAGTLAKRQAFLEQNYSYLKGLFMKAHPGADPSTFQQSIAGLDLSRNSLLSLANVQNKQTEMQAAMDNADQGDFDAQKQFQDQQTTRRGQDLSNRAAMANAGSNAVRAKAAAQTAGTYRSIADQAMGKGGGKVQPAPGGRIYGSALPPGIPLDPPPSN